MKLMSFDYAMIKEHLVNGDAFQMSENVVHEYFSKKKNKRKGH